MSGQSRGRQAGRSGWTAEPARETRAFETVFSGRGVRKASSQNQFSNILGLGQRCGGYAQQDPKNDPTFLGVGDAARGAPRGMRGRAEAESTELASGSSGVQARAPGQKLRGSGTVPAGSWPARLPLCLQRVTIERALEGSGLCC